VAVCKLQVRVVALSHTSGVVVVQFMCSICDELEGVFHCLNFQNFSVMLCIYRCRMHTLNILSHKQIPKLIMSAYERLTNFYSVVEFVCAHSKKVHVQKFASDFYS
jgi:hypothetical protein